MTPGEFESLARKNGKRLFNVAYRICGNREDAEDVVQQALERAFRSLSAFRGESEPATWVHRIVVNEALRRKGSVNHKYVDSLLDAAEKLETEIPDEARMLLQDPAEATAQRELVRTIREACLHFSTFTLSAEQRVVYVLRVAFDFSNKEIAEICQISVGTVKSRLHRARENLKRVFFRDCSWLHPNGSCSCERRFGVAFALKPDILRITREIAATGMNGDLEDDQVGPFPDIDKLYQSVRAEAFDPSQLRIEV